MNEAVEAAYKLEDRVGVSLGPLIVNGCLPSRRRPSRRIPLRPRRMPGPRSPTSLLAALGEAAAVHGEGARTSRTSSCTGSRTSCPCARSACLRYRRGDRSRRARARSRRR